MKNKILTSVILILFLLTTFDVQAANFKDHQKVTSNKTWTVKFTNETILDDLTKQNITVTNNKGIKENAALQLGEDKKTVLVTAPEEGYKLGEDYSLIVGKNVQSKAGKALNKEYKLNFSIKGDEEKTLNEKFETKIKSGNLSTDYNINQALSDIKKFKLNTVNIPVVIKIKNVSSTNMEVDNDSKERAIELIKRLKGTNINIILEPYPWIEGGKEYETNWKPNDINTFFWNWKTTVLKPLIDDIANPYKIDALNIGSSFVNMEYAEGYWCDTIDYVRTLYKGLVTYRTGWWYTEEAYQKKLNNSMFSKLDFISIAAYFELTDKKANIDTNTVENLVSAIQNTQSYNINQNVKEEIKNLHNKWNKKIFFGELGFPKINKASAEPWNPFQNDIVNEKEQANCFEAYKKEFENEAWLLGFSIFAIGDKGQDKRYYPSEQSASVIRTWYNKD